MFTGCTLVVLGGAQVTLERCCFKDMNDSAICLSIFAHGAGSKVVVKGGSITGGEQGVAVHAGACLEACDLTITGVRWVGVEGQGEGTSVDLTNCKINKFAPEHRIGHVKYGSKTWVNAIIYPSAPRYGIVVPGDSDMYRVGVHVHSSCSAHLSNVSIRGMELGVSVRTHACAQITECTVKDTIDHSVLVQEGGTGHLDRCSLARSRRCGLVVQGSSSRAQAVGCTFEKNRGAGAGAELGGTLHATDCKSVWNGVGDEQAGYEATFDGVVQLTGCKSDGDYYGCWARSGGKLAADKVDVSNSLLSGWYLQLGGDAVLKDCTVTGCKRNGVTVHNKSSKRRKLAEEQDLPDCFATSRLDMERCTLHSNGECGVLAAGAAEVRVRGGRSVGHSQFAYCAHGAAQMSVYGSACDGDRVRNVYMHASVGEAHRRGKSLPVACV